MANLSSAIKLHLSPKQVRILNLASEFSQKAGVGICLVGGTVRDLLLGQSPVDIDITVVTPPQGFDSELAQFLGGTVASRSHFGTSKLSVDGMEIDLAMARRESYERPGALPIVEPGTLDDDLARRDFSINALASSLNRNSWGEIVDQAGGQYDLKSGVIRVLHSNSFVDDSTRILRAVRYAGRLGFRLDGETERLIRRDLGYLATIKGERIRHEFQRIFRESEAPRILRFARELRALSAIFEPLDLSESILQKMVEIERKEENDLLFISLLAYGLPSNQLEGFIARLSMDGRWAKAVRDVGGIRNVFEALRVPDIRNSQLFHLLKPFDAFALRCCVLASDDFLVSERIEAFLSKLSGAHGILNGDDIIALGVPQGAAVGRLLEEIRDSRLDGHIQSKDDEEAFVRSKLNEAS